MRGSSLYVVMYVWCGEVDCLGIYDTFELAKARAASCKNEYPLVSIEEVALNEELYWPIA